eukprot:2550098-Pyramimonas_sp.AAC.1
MTSVGCAIGRCRDDAFVRFTGCCADDSSEQCCCGISNRGGDECVDARSVYNEWAAFVNHCDEPESAPASHLGAPLYHCTAVLLYHCVPLRRA